ncbi:hypothetical protein BOTBODRAFT_37766 [Botryobasidium botryosum FD-172 SS1]|uniref:Cytochrome P450 n=1 Tax=Botryobasidium botryosum (strain FD-172 SS1) TaxID=930990 RepID=A0A067M9R8_BOTB1|nr:hypothetical protein BOTBODRAFT_37766 [Botryobasidium botryosum FD-172 SS1]
MHHVIGYTPQFDKESPHVLDRVFGGNIVTAEKEQWKRHRRALNPAFSQKIYIRAWKEGVRIYYDMVAGEGWNNATGSTPVFIANHVVTKFTLGVISSCAFGLDFSWSEPIAASVEEKMTLQEALKIVSAEVPIWAVAPRWLFRLPFKYLRRIDDAFKTISDFAKSQIEQQKIQQGSSTEKIEKIDICNMIVQANLDGGKASLSEEEVLGDTFAVLIAGHDTTAKTLSATMGLLGLYQDEQEKAYQQICSILSGGREPTLEDVDSFSCVQHCFLEAIRLFPAGDVFARKAAEDTLVRAHSRIPGEQDIEFVVKKGDTTAIDSTGINYNPRYFPDPEAFKPSRWDAPSSVSDTFIGFGHGPRASIGRKFAMIEATCFLVHLLRDWKIEVVLGEEETMEQWRERVMVATVEITLGVNSVPVRLTRRH